MIVGLLDTIRVEKDRLIDRIFAIGCPVHENMKDFDTLTALVTLERELKEDEHE